MTKFTPTQGQWHRAKAHVAKGHEAEKRRLQIKGGIIGGVTGGTAKALASAIALSRGKKKSALVIASLPTIIGGTALGTVIGRYIAHRRLALSQRRHDHGHYSEREKVAMDKGDKGAWIGAGLGALPSAVDIAEAIHRTHKRKALRPHTWRHAALYGALIGLGAGVGRVVGDRMDKKANVIAETATKVRGQIQGVKRALMVKPVAHKPAVVATPQPPTPMVEPTTLTPNMSPAMKMGSLEGIRRARGRKKAEGKSGEPAQTWKGQAAGRWQRPGPENEVDFEFWRGHDF